MRLRLALLLAVAALATGAAPAAAGTVTASVSATTLLVTASGSVDELVLRPDGSSVEVAAFYDGTTVTAGDGCTVAPGNTTTVTCPARPDVGLNGDAGSQYVRVVGVCFATGTFDLGGGTNRYSGEQPSSCTSAHQISGGEGQDRFDGGTESNVTETFFGFGGDDSFFGGGGNDVIVAGPGNDAVSGGPGDDALAGNTGNDALLGSAGNDGYDGGEGDDTIGVSLGGDDDQGADDLRGGPGNDYLDLHGHTGGMAISLDDAPNDGAPGEGDNIRADIERIRGTAANDTYVGNAAPNDFNGDSGADTIRGGDGADTLDGSSDADQVFGDGGADTLYGSSGDDVVEGGAGTDSLFGDTSGCSQQSCPGGNDQLRARDGELDQVNCGAGADIATIDAPDVAALDGFQACEQIDRARAGGPGGTPAAFAFKTTGTLSRARGVRVRLTCPAACSYTATIVLGSVNARRYKLGRRSVTIATARGSLLKAGSRTVRVKLSKKARSRLRRARNVSATLRLAVRDPAGKTTRRQRAVLLRR